MRKIILILAVVFQVVVFADEGEGDFVDLANEMIGEWAAEVLERYQVELTAIGGEASEIEIESFELEFQAAKELGVPAARQLLVEIMESLLHVINGKELRPYLQVYPFEAPQVKMAIALEKAPGVPLSNRKHVASIFCGAGFVSYSCLHRSKMSLRGMHDEMYEEALAITEGKIPDSFVQKKNKSNHRLSRKVNLKER